MTAQEARMRLEAKINNELAPFFKLIERAIEQGSNSTDLIDQFDINTRQRQHLEALGYKIVPSGSSLWIKF